MGVAWTDDLIKRRLSEEKKYYKAYKHVDVRFYNHWYITILVTIGIIENKDFNKFVCIISSLIKIQ